MVFISMMLVCYASDIAVYDRRTSQLSNAPLSITNGTNSIEQYLLKEQ